MVEYGKPKPEQGTENKQKVHLDPLTEIIQLYGIAFVVGEYDLVTSAPREHLESLAQTLDISELLDEVGKDFDSEYPDIQEQFTSALNSRIGSLPDEVSGEDLLKCIVASIEVASNTKTRIKAGYSYISDRSFHAFADKAFFSLDKILDHFGVPESIDAISFLLSEMLKSETEIKTKQYRWTEGLSPDIQ